ncbi:hypothetical protein AAF712_013657 [Marasmius tenuissimus]|uniref:F-box domain-containing protein n=1 Tax=Marasmius tenuissimus TaxID=585030 RepID=A0ABR2ZDD3_9AGAR
MPDPAVSSQTADLTSDLDVQSSASTHELENGRFTSPDIPLVPLEIISRILKDVSRRDDLRSISLVSSIWRHAAQASLFEDIRMTNGDECKFWSRKFKRYPHLGRYVKHLHFGHTSEDCVERAYLRSRTAKALVSSLPNVRYLYLYDINRWSEVELRLVKSMSRSVRFLYLGKAPAIGRRRALPALLYALPNVENLCGGLPGGYDDLASLHKAGLAMRDYIPEDKKPRRLRQLIIVEVEIAIDLLLWLTGPAFDLSNLHILTLSWCILADPALYDTTVIDDFIRLVGNHVTDLTLMIPLNIFSSQAPKSYHPSRRRHDPSDCLTEHFINSDILQHFGALEIITLACNEIPDGDTALISPVHVCNTKFILGAISKTASRLRTIVIEIEIEEILPEWQLDYFCDVDLGWSILDELWAEDDFPCLQLVKMKIDITVDDRRHGSGTPIANQIKSVEEAAPALVLEESELFTASVEDCKCKPEPPPMLSLICELRALPLRASMEREPLVSSLGQ